MRLLDVYLHEKFSGQLVQNEAGGLSFTYAQDYINQNNPALSISLPLRSEPYEGDKVKAFFSGLLPDEIVRHKLARYLGVSERNPFALLEAIGGECAGALSLYPTGQYPPLEDWDDIEILNEQKLSDILELLKRRPFLAGDNGLRLSLAGAQDKMAVGVIDGKIALVKGSRPTTHILKPAITDIKDSVYNELFCMRLAQMVGIEVPTVEVGYNKDHPYFLIKRYDRVQTEDGTVRRLHQEDFCQALGIMPDVKYEREGGPSLNQCQNILLQCAARPAIEQINFLKRVIFNYLIGNADAHGKNFSLLYKGRKPDLAPAYDLLSTAVYSELSSKMAMKIGGKYLPGEVFIRHWHTLVPEKKTATTNLDKQLLSLSNDCMEKSYLLEEELKNSGISSAIFTQIKQVIEKNASHIIRQIN